MKYKSPKTCAAIAALIATLAGCDNQTPEQQIWELSIRNYGSFEKAEPMTTAALGIPPIEGSPKLEHATAHMLHRTGGVYVGRLHPGNADEEKMRSICRDMASTMLKSEAAKLDAISYGEQVVSGLKGVRCSIETEDPVQMKGVEALVLMDADTGILWHIGYFFWQMKSDFGGSLSDAQSEARAALKSIKLNRALPAQIA